MEIYEYCGISIIILLFLLYYVWLVCKILKRNQSCCRNNSVNHPPDHPPAPAMSSTTQQEKNKINAFESNNDSKNDSKKKIKLAIYHMNGCGHCYDLMRTKQKNGNTKFEELKNIFKNNDRVEIVDYLYSRDKEANKFNAFPVIEITTDCGAMEFNDSREVGDMANKLHSLLKQ